MMTDELERQLMEVRKVNVIVASFLNDANRGYMDREEALTRIVLALHDEGVHLKARIQSLMEKGVPPVVLNMSSADMEKITPILNAASEIERLNPTMTEFNNSHTSLDDVHVGDHVAIKRSSIGEGYWMLMTVTAETKTTLTVDGSKYVRRTGHRYGTASRWYRDRIEALGDVSGYGDRKTTYADDIRADAIRLADDRRRQKALDIISAVGWRKLSTETLKQVAAIVEAEQKAKEER